MFYRVPHTALGFSEDEWDTMNRGDRVIIRDYYLNGGDREQTSLYCEYDTIYQVRKVERKYNLEQRPKLVIRFTNFQLVE